MFFFLLYFLLSIICNIPSVSLVTLSSSIVYIYSDYPLCAMVKFFLNKLDNYNSDWQHRDSGSRNKGAILQKKPLITDDQDSQIFNKMDESN